MSQDKDLRSPAHPRAVSLSGSLLGLLLAGATLGAEMDLDCSKPQQARAWVGRLMLAEIEGAEDIHRQAMWEAFGRCPAGTGGAPCRAKTQARFEAEWTREKQGIEDKYGKMLSDFEKRCRAAITGTGIPGCRGQVLHCDI